MIVQAAGGKNVIVPLRDWRYDLDSMASGITGSTKMIFIANPNNPTGTINTTREMDAFMERVPDGVLVVIDEAYYEYVTSPDYPDTIKYFREGRDILVLRTFSKIYGLAALRIGYGIAQQSIVSDMNRVRQPFNVNSLAQCAARAVLQDEAYLERARQINNEGKKYLYRELDALNIGYVPSETNFVYIILKTASAGDYYDQLLRKGIIVRPMGSRELRVTVGLQKENERFIETLKQLRNQK
jgi:histidinol-phosphate aminotransferase